MKAWLALALATVAASPPPRATLDDWRIEAEDPHARVTLQGDTFDIDTAEGLTLWYRRALSGRIAIDYDVMPVAAGGANDAVSDANAFWMARDSRRRSVLATRRSGAFADYDDLHAYYVGIGGNRNTTTRFRRYVGRRGDRPLLPQHDRGDAGTMLVANRWTHVRLIADGRRIAVERDGGPLFVLDDAAPYTRGHFGFRTTKSHLRIRGFRVTRLAR